MTAQNPLFRSSQPTPQTENRYARFGLKQNPFPDEPIIVPGSHDPRLNGEIYRADLRSSEETRFEHLLIPHVGQQSVPIALLMDYATRRGRGIGKTAFLNYQRRRIMADLGNDLTQGASVLVAAHLIPEGGGRTRRFWQFIRLIATSLNRDNCIAWALWRLRAASGLVPGSVLAQVNPQVPESTLGNDRWLIERGVDVYWSLNRQIEHTLKNLGVDEQVARLLSQHGHAPDSFEAQLLGDKSDVYWRQDGYRLVFDDLVHLFRASGINQAVLLVDEVEKMVIPQNSNERRAFVEDIRRFFVDGPFQSVHHRFFNLLLTIHPYVQEIWSPHWNAAGLDRVCAISGGLAQEYTIYFRPLDAQVTAVPLVLAYMNFFRIDEADKDTLRPFDQEAVVEALRLSGGVPGPMLKLLKLVLDKALAQEESEIRSKQVRAMYESFVPPEPTDDELSRRLPPPQTDLRGEE